MHSSPPPSPPTDTASSVVRLRTTSVDSSASAQLPSEASWKLPLAGGGRGGRFVERFYARTLVPFLVRGHHSAFLVCLLGALALLSGWQATNLQTSPHDLVVVADGGSYGLAWP